VVDVEQQIRDRLVRDSKAYVFLIGCRQTTREAAADGLVRHSHGDPDRLRAAAAQLRAEDPSAARALALLDAAAVETAETPPAPEPRRCWPPWGAGWFSEPTRRTGTVRDTDYMRLRGPGGITVEQVDFVDKAGHRQRVLRARQHGVFLGDFRSVEELAKVLDVSELTEDDDPGQDPAG
jgi:hypothetical protein